MKKNKDFELKTLWRAFIAFWLLIAIVTAVGGAAGGVYSLVKDKTVYTAYASFWVNAKATGGVSQSATMGAAQLATNYVELADTTALATYAVKQGGLAAKWNSTEDEAVKTLSSMISAGKTDIDSMMFHVYIKSGNKQLTYDAIKAVQEHMIPFIASVNDDGEVVRVAEVYSMDDVYTSTPSLLKKALIGMAAGFVLSYAIAFLLYVFNRRARYADELAEDIDIPVVALPDIFYKKGREKKITPDEAASAFLSAGDMVRALVGEGKVVAVTTPSFADPNAAFSVAEAYVSKGKRTLVIECDARLPLAADILEAEENTVGLDAFISGGKTPTVITVVENYDVITVGAQGSGYLSLIDVKKLVGAVGDGYDAIILSLPPVDLLLDLSEIAGFATPVLAISYGDRVDELASANKLLADFGATPSAVYYLPL